MNKLQSNDSFFINSYRSAYIALQGGYRKIRTLKNRLCNSIDPPIIVLVYHRVTDLSPDPQMLAVSPFHFRNHMEFLKQHYRIVRFDEDWSQLKDSAVAITFDDGYADNVLEALPILEDVGVPATFFVSTGFMENCKLFWWDRLETILMREAEYPACFELNDVRYGRTWKTDSLEKRQELYSFLTPLMLKVVPERREEWLDQLERWAELDEGVENRHRTMSPEELLKLAASPWATIGAHTVTHSALSALNKEQQRMEIHTSKQKLETTIKNEITTFSYPFGRKEHYDRVSVRLCREAGFKKAASNFPGQVHRWTDPFQLPRHLVRNWEISRFASELKGFWTR